MKNFFTKSLSSAIALCILFALQCTNVFGQNETNTWIQKTDFGGTARKVATGFSINGKGYILTGNDGAYEQDMWEWDQMANTWTQKADFAGGVRGDAVGFAIGNKGYVITGGPSFWEVTNDFWEWDQPTNTWIQKADFAGAARTRATGFAIGTKGYVTTGYNGSFFNDLWEWDQATDTWTEKSDFPGSARWDAVGFSIGTKGYIGCGYDGSSIVGDFWEYDQATDTWTEKADVGGDTRSAPIGFSINGKGYIGLGATDPSAVVYLNDFWQYDPGTDTWTAKANYGGPGRADKVGFAIDNVGYIGTGYNETVSYKDFWEYSPNTLIIYNTHTDLTCGGGNNGQAAVSVSGGTSPYTYYWTGGQTTSSISGLAAGTYTCTVTDAAAVTQTSNIIVGPVPPVVVTTSGTQSICNGSSTTLAACGADTYTWAPGTGLNATTGSTVAANPFVTTTYTVTGTVSGGCTGSNVAIITVTQSHFANAGNDTSIYVGLSALIGGSPAATGGTPPYIYAWSPSIGLSETDSANVTATPPTTTIYALSVTDSNMCVSTDTMVLTIKPIPIDILERIASSTYIFEGNVVNSTSYWNHDKREIYTANTIQISQVLKGDINCGTVELIALGGTVDSVTEDVSHALHLRKGNAGVFLCNTTTREAPPTPFYYESDPQVLEPPFEENSFVNYWWDGLETQASDMSHSYGTVGQIYAISAMLTGLTWTNCASEESIYLKKIVPPKDTTHPIAFIHTYNAPASHRRLRDDDTTIYYTMDNVEITGTNPQYVEFDIYVSSFDEGLYLNAAEINLLYDTTKYGTNIFYNNNITVSTTGTIVDDPFTYEPVSIFDGPYGNTVSISISAIPPWDSALYLNQSLLTASAQKLFHVKITIADCAPPHSNISFTDQEGMAEASQFAYSPDEDSIVNHFTDDTSFQTISVTPCGTLEIKGFSPTTLNAGVGDTLTITGYNFGETQGSGNLYFKNADNGGKSQIGLNPYDIPIWSDTLIKVVIPSFIDTMPPPLPLQPLDNPVGSGTFTLVTNGDSAYTTGQPLTVRYAVLNDTLGGKKTQRLLEGRNNNNGYIFYVDTIIWRHPMMLACVKKALRDWTCLTQVNWKVDSFYVAKRDTNFFRDSVNFIHFGKVGKVFSNGTTLAQTHSFHLTCNNQSVTDEIDMAINDSVTWVFDTLRTSFGKDTIDFYAELLHELGHGHSLDHVNDSTAIMYYAKPAKGLPAKIHLETDPSAGLGGNEVMNISTGSLFPKDMCYGIHIMIPDSICRTYVNGVQTIFNPNEINVYPNPAGEGVNVVFSVNTEIENHLSLSNMYGQTLLLIPPSQIHYGKNLIPINLENYPPGIYLLTGEINGNYSEFKIVHLNTH